MAKMRIYIVDLESVPSRYTCEWKHHLPAMLSEEVRKSGKDIQIINISGGDEPIEASPGAFLNFQKTNIYKNEQLNNIARRFSNEVKPGDRFLFADAWHTGILQLKYMSELLQIPVEIHALWHAGSYDPQDFLGRLVKDKKWTYATERAIFNAVDHNYFATIYHVDLFAKTFCDQSLMTVDEWKRFQFNRRKIIRTGWPMDYMPAVTNTMCDQQAKDDIIIFPHRIAPEKQPEIFRDLAKFMPEYQFIVCQDNNLSKQEYHKLLSRSKIMWSANLQETLGISPFEGALHGVIPMLPNRLSYTEMYDSKYLYPEQWTTSFETYTMFKPVIMNNIKIVMENYADFSTDVRKNLTPHLLQNFFTAGPLVNKLLGD
jgi:hypothetical protein